MPWDNYYIWPEDDYVDAMQDGPSLDIWDLKEIRHETEKARLCLIGDSVGIREGGLTWIPKSVSNVFDLDGDMQISIQGWFKLTFLEDKK